MVKSFVGQRIILFSICFFLAVAIVRVQAGPGNADTAYINRLNAKSFEQLKSDPDSARNLATEAIRLSEPDNYLVGLGDGYIRLGILEKDEGNYEQAIAY